MSSVAFLAPSRLYRPVPHISNSVMSKTIVLQHQHTVTSMWGVPGTPYPITRILLLLWPRPCASELPADAFLDVADKLLVVKPKRTCAASDCLVEWSDVSGVLPSLAQLSHTPLCAPDRLTEE